MRASLARLCTLALPLSLAATACGQAADSGGEIAVNYVAATERLHTAGQPDAATLATLAEQGFELVVNLAPPSSQGAVPDEGKLVAEDGPTYVNIPVSWQQPTYEDFELFSAVMNGARDRKVLVHCQLNMRASAFTFLYRVVHEGVAARGSDGSAARRLDSARSVGDVHGRRARAAQRRLRAAEALTRTLPKN